MTRSTKQRGGSFRELRNRHLPMFDDRVHRHDRGWPHPPPETAEPRAPKHRWRTVGIVHFRDEEDCVN